MFSEKKGPLLHGMGAVDLCHALGRDVPRIKKALN